MSFLCSRSAPCPKKRSRNKVHNGVVLYLMQYSTFFFCRFYAVIKHFLCMGSFLIYFLYKNVLKETIKNFLMSYVSNFFNIHKYVITCTYVKNKVASQPQNSLHAHSMKYRVFHVKVSESKPIFG